MATSTGERAPPPSGSALRTARLLLRRFVAFGTLGLGRVYAAHFPWNPASGRVLAAAGLRPEGTLRGHYLKHGRRIDAVMFGILREEHVACGAPRQDGPGADGASGDRL